MAYIPLFTKWHSTLPRLAAAPENQSVILLHGIAKSSRHMRPMAQYLLNLGYDVHNLDYPSTDLDIKKSIHNVAKEISPIIDQHSVNHFVGYSLGGLIVRGVLHRLQPKNLGNIVQLGSPNGGSEVASFLRPFPPYQFFFGPAGQELATENSVALNQNLGEVNYTLGIIAGNKSIDPVSSLLIEGSDDGKVSVESTKLPGMRDHITLPVTHLHFPNYEIVHYQTGFFLQNGSFDLEHIKG